MGENTKITTPLFKKIHCIPESLQAKGTFQSIKGKGIFNTILWKCIGIPITTKETPFQLKIEGSQKIWNRKFGNKIFKTQTKINGCIFRERKGIFEFVFQLKDNNKTLRYECIGFTVLKIPIPKALRIHPKAICILIDDNTWRFEVETLSPFGKSVLKYWGKAKLISK